LQFAKVTIISQCSLTEAVCHSLFTYHMLSDKMYHDSTRKQHRFNSIGKEDESYHCSQSLAMVLRTNAE